MLILLLLLVLAGLWAVMTSLLIRAAIALALSSAILTMIMFQLGAPLAGVLELSVCSGLISVVFITVISLTHRLPHPEYLARREDRISRFWLLPFIMLAVAAVLFFIPKPAGVFGHHPVIAGDVRAIMWNLRQPDMFAQIMILLAGAYGVLILFKGRKNDDA